MITRILFLFVLAAPLVSTYAEDAHIEVQHILVEVETRSKAEAEKLAKEVFAKAGKKGANFDHLVRMFTDDAIPGKYKLANKGVKPLSADEYRREDMVAGFGDLSFKLGPNKVGLVAFDEKKSPYGFHIIKRIK